MKKVEKSFMQARFMKVIILFVFCLLSAFSCNQVIDLPPVEPGPDPAAAVKVVKTWYPEAENLVFKSLLEDKVWEVKFDSRSDRYSSLVDSSKMWETFRANPDQFPAEMTDLIGNSALKGGIFSQNVEDVGFYTTGNYRVRPRYTLNGTEYSLNFLRIGTFTADATFTNTLYYIGIDGVSSLPPAIQSFFAANPDLKFENGDVRILLNYEKQYAMQVTFDKYGKRAWGDMLFDEKGNLKWISRGFNQPELLPAPTNFGNYPPAIQQHLDASPELADFEIISGLDRWKGEYKGTTSYTLIFYHKTERLGCELQFDQDGVLVYKKYYFLV